MTNQRLGKRRRTPIQRIRSYHRHQRIHAPINKENLQLCPNCNGAFLHYRDCPHFNGADHMTIRAEAARAAKARCN